MALPLQLRWQTPAAWTDTALSDLDSFLSDHASCERKASANALSFVVKYPDRTNLVDSMIQLAREELRHFQQVYRLLLDRGQPLRRDEEDRYVTSLIRLVRHPRDERFLDRLLVAALIEARSHERLEMVGKAIADPKLQKFYSELARAESTHCTLFIDLAREYFQGEVVDERLNQFLDWEAAAIRALPFGVRVH